MAVANSSQRDQILGYVRDCRTRSERVSASFKARLPRYYELWRGLYTGTASVTKNDVHLPLIFATIQTDVARKLATSFGQWPPINYVGYGEDDVSVARKHDSLFSAQFRDANGLRKEYLNLLRADLYGRAISRIMWDHKEEVQTREEWKALPLSGDRVRQIMRARVVTFDGPNYEPVDLLDAMPCPGYLFEDDMPWYQIRYYLTIDQAEFLASEQGGRIFDAAEVARIKRDGGAAAFRQDEALIRRFEARTGWQTQPESDKNLQVLEIIEHYGHAPQGLGIGSTNTIITTANNEKYLLRAEDTPFRNRKKPIISTTPTMDPSYYWAPGKAEVAEKMQIVANRFINQQLDAADVVIHPTVVYDQRKLVNPRNMQIGPGRAIATHGPPGDVFTPLQFDMRGLNVSAAQVSQMWAMMQMGSGIMEGPVMGFDSGKSDRTTARQFVGEREAAGTRLMAESVMYESLYLEPLADWFASLNSYLLEVPRQLLILGDAATNDPVTGQPIQTTRETIYGWDLGTQYTARAMGSTSTITKSAKQQNDLTMFQVLAGAQPALMGAFNMVNFLRQMLRSLDYKNVNELIQKQPQVAEMLAGSGMEGAGAVPESDPSAGMLQAMGGEGGGPSIAGLLG